MRHAYAFFVAAVLIAVGFANGCGNQKSAAYAAKIRDLESKFSKLDDDYRATLAMSESRGKKISQLETQRSEMQKQIASLSEEKDGLSKQVGERTGERDALYTHITQFHQDLQNITNRVQTVASQAPAAKLTIAIPASRRSE